LAGLSFDDQIREKLQVVMLKDPDPDIRKEVAAALGKVKNEKAITALEEVRVGDNDIAVRQEADNAIKNIKPGN
jgi:HEAT repeat protein